MSTSRPTPSRKSSSDGKRRSAPTPSSSKEDTTAKTPKSILKTSRRGIKVTRTEKASDGYADDSPYWAAAKLASTQPKNDDDSSSSEESMNSTQKRQTEKKAKKDQKKTQKKKETLEQRRKLKQKYMDGQAKVKPNFKGAESDNDEEESSGASGDEKMNGNSSQNGEWLKETLDEKHKSKNIFSPSDLSRASTIPPTPASTKTAKSAKSLGDFDISVDMDVNDDAHDFHVSYDNEDDDVGNNSENDNDQPLASSLSPIHEEEHVAGERKKYELEDNIDYVVDEVDEAKPDTPAKSIQANDNDNDSDGGYDEGPGFELNDEMPSPPAPSPPPSDNEDDKSVRKSPTLRSSPRSSSKKRSRTESVQNSDSEDSEEGQQSRKEKKKKSKRGRPRKKKVNFSQGYQTGPREYKTIPAEEYDGEDGPAGVRRSKRRKFEPLQFWKNEKIVYEANRDDGSDAEIFGDMPMVTGIQKAEPTPYKKRSITRRVESDDESAATGKKSKKKSTSASQEETPYDCSKLRKKVNIIDSDKALVWNEYSGSSEEVRLICRKNELNLLPLPLQKGMRTKEEGKITVKAAQAFNVPAQSAQFPGFICGCMELPPKGIKDEEGVGPCAQVFNVGDCQPNSVEVSIADPDSNNGNYERETASRYLLSKGDFFHVPAGNVYRIQNHSKTTSCTLNWIIIRAEM